MLSFPSLHTHTSASILDGVPSPSQYFEKCDELEISAIAFTDHGNMGALAEATVESKDFKVKPIMGMEAYMVFDVDKAIADKEAGNNMDIHRKANHIVLLAKNEAGYKNLISLNNFAWTTGFYYSPRIDFKRLFEHKEGIICTSACLAGIIPRLLEAKRYKFAKKIAKKMKREFGKDFFLELQLIDMIEQDESNKKLIELGTDLKIPFVVSNDVHFLNKGDHELQAMLMEISRGEAFYSAPENYLKTMKEWEQIKNDRKSIPKKIFHQAVDNCFKVANRCDYTVPIGGLFFPVYDHETHFLYKKFPVKDKEQFFKKMLIYRAKKLLGGLFDDKNYRKRLAFEYKTFVSLGAVDYMLICDDLLNYVRNEGAFSLIRGSANGSLIAFVLGFGLIDPIKHGILFERFVSKYRSLNDVDVDIDVRSEFRGKAVRYLKDKYGDDRVVSVGTYNRIQLKGSVKDTTRVLKKRLEDKMKGTSKKEKEKLFNEQKDYQFSVINKITTPITGNPPIDLARDQYKVFSEWWEKNEEIAERYIRPLVGSIRNPSLHPAGVVITPESVNDLLPIRTQPNPQNKKERVVSTVWENSHTSREDLNEVGVMILDVLGVRTLSVVSEIISLAKKDKGINIDLYNLPLDDAKTIKAFNDHELLGVFQFSGSSASKIVSMIPITEFNDLIVINAIARPGALSAGADKSFAKRKRNPSLIQYQHRSMEKILNDASGILVFSEHILRTASEFAGMHPKRADNLRKIIKGKDLAKFKSYKKEFIEGAVKKWKGEKNIEKIAEKIWKKFSEAGSYLFPRGHAASYALLGYICQYLKVNYPSEFFACHLRFAAQDKYKEIRDVAVKHYGIKFIMPTINAPSTTFEVATEGILWPLTAIKSIGPKAAETILQQTPFISVKDFYDRINRRSCNSRIVENLIIAGMFKEFGKKRDVLLEYRTIKGKKELEKDLPLAFESKENMVEAMSNLYGFDLIPLKKLYKKKLKKYKKFTTWKQFQSFDRWAKVLIWGKIVEKKLITTKKNKKMAFIHIDNGKDVFKVTLFPEALEKVDYKIDKGSMIVLSGVKNVWGTEESIILSTDKKTGELSSGSWINSL